jgi:hypothetical protein
MNRTTEMFGFVELDLQVERFSRLARPAQAIDVRSIRTAEASQPGDPPCSHGATA